MALTALDHLRLLVDDEMPVDATEPMFDDVTLQALLDGAGGSAERAAADVWKIKAARYSSLVDVTEGNASRAMSDMQAHALNMVKQFEKSTTGPTEGRTRIGRIRRSR